MNCRRSVRFPTLLLVGLLAACGGEKPEELQAAARTALEKGEYAEAEKLADEALAAGVANLNFSLRCLRAEALAGQGKGPEAVSELEALAKDNSAQMTPNHYLKPMNTALAADKTTTAIEILDAGAKRFADNKDSFAKAASDLKQAAEGDPEAMALLKSLGYL